MSKRYWSHICARLPSCSGNFARRYNEGGIDRNTAAPLTNPRVSNEYIISPARMEGRIGQRCALEGEGREREGRQAAAAASFAWKFMAGSRD